ncbi:hypothetical protein [Streptomyces spectabilis]|uniref:CDP-glycerol glycerophosphotransferase family protein n=1 Tax=Streptomyces spectabilis TaxID=68270 RepID=A0A7W8AYU8_STRST|nr:hypothetical protein [Streptomyces spectabilis]MBB5107184.1 hypothetical protein [Streptomyces spectabilis]MCI3906230.1 hypothetical protein [Streptomyces spectabilis]GGV04010.1 hypothetical protein GCM10010245_08940 [Streptomyces spectabilis]
MERTQWLTLPGCKRVLVVVHTEVYGQRLGDLLPLLESDLRVQVDFTVAPHAFNAGAPRSLKALGAPVLPWRAALRGDFDLVLAAGSQGVERLRGPLVRLPHGAGHMKLSRPLDDRDPGAPRTVGGLGPQYLMRDGRVVPAALALAHEDDLATLGRCCPAALPVAEVVGDATYDRIVASLPLRRRYRAALGLRGGRKLLLVCSTWGPGSSFSRFDALLPRLLTELPRQEFQVAVLVHPNVWAGHGDWQVRSWLAAARRHGIAVLPPEADWRAPLIAADWVIGDHGSVTLYATLTRAAVLLARFPEADVDPASPGAELARVAPALSFARPLPEQLAYARAEYPGERYARIGRRISSEPGRFGRNARRLLYRVLGLGEPAYAPALPPLPVPRRGARGGRDEVPA